MGVAWKYWTFVCNNILLITGISLPMLINASILKLLVCTVTVGQQFNSFSPLVEKLCCVISVYKSGGNWLFINTVYVGCQLSFNVEGWLLISFSCCFPFPVWIGRIYAIFYLNSARCARPLYYFNLFYVNLVVSSSSLFSLPNFLLPRLLLYSVLLPLVTYI